MAKRGPKRNKAERERDRADISTLYLRGWTHSGKLQQKSTGDITTMLMTNHPSHVPQLSTI